MNRDVAMAHCVNCASAQPINTPAEFEPFRIVVDVINYVTNLAFIHHIRPVDGIILRSTHIMQCNIPSVSHFSRSGSTVLHCVIYYL